MQPEILLFGGTTEGRTLTHALLEAGYAVTCSVATEYGGQLLDPRPGLTILAGRLDQDAMVLQMQSRPFAAVVDATHPYAADVTQNVRGAAASTGLCYYRLLRPEALVEDALWADSPAHAVELLAHTTGNILLTTGSKDLKTFATLPDYQNRLYVRILPAQESLALALAAGIHPTHIICMQGVGSVELNLALLRQFDCTHLVTKNSGKEGGFRIKCQAAQQAQARVVVIRRPHEEQGYTLEELTHLLCLNREGIP